MTHPPYTFLFGFIRFYSISAKWQRLAWFVKGPGISILFHSVVPGMCYGSHLFHSVLIHSQRARGAHRPGGD
jgi:hypothetical protein